MRVNNLLHSRIYARLQFRFRFPFLLVCNCFDFFTILFFADAPQSSCHLIESQLNGILLPTINDADESNNNSVNCEQSLWQPRLIYMRVCVGKCVRIAIVKKCLWEILINASYNQLDM